ncbi:MAG: tetratricopeptide repeat protein [Bacteroidota bacterium]
MKYLKIKLILLLVLMEGIVAAQGLMMRIANKHMRQMRYDDAIEIYEKVLEKNSNNGVAIANLAEAYRKTNNFQKAEIHYQKLMFLPEVRSVDRLYYAQVLQKNAKCHIAKRWYKKYMLDVPDDIRGQLLARTCDYQQELLNKNKGVYEVHCLWFNSISDDFSPVFFSDGLVFTSDREHEGQIAKRSVAENNRPFLNLYRSRMAPSDNDISTTCNYVHTEPVLVESPINSKFHEGSSVFTADEQEMFITKSGVVEEGFMPKGSSHLQLFYSRKMRGRWTIPEPLSFNGAQYSIAHPALSADGKYLYFSSNMPGGYGGMDLYRVERIENRWGDLINLGPQVNTEGNEVFPTCDRTGRIYFSSDSQIGLGGLDIYFSEELEKDEWSVPENLGHPINSIGDDFGIIFNNEGTCGYFTSNRKSGKGGDDIYSFVKRTASVQVLVYDARTGVPINASIVEDTCTQQKFRTNANGKIVFDMPLNRCCTFKASMPNYHSNVAEGCTNALTPGEEVFVEIPLKEKLIFNLTGIVFDQYTGLPINNSTVYLLSECGVGQTRPLVTDASGRFTFSLKEQCCYAIQATHEDYYGKILKGYCTRSEQSKDFITKLYLEARQ